MNGFETPLRVAVDARVVFDETPRGIGQTVACLYRALAAARPDWRFDLYCRTPDPAPLFAGCANVAARPLEMRGDRFELWPRLRLPWAVARGGAHVFHAAAGPAPTLVRGPLVTTIYDLIPIDAGRADPAARHWARRVRSAALRAKVVLTSSAHARDRIVDLLGIDAGKVRLVRWGPVTAPKAPPGAARRAELAGRYGFAPTGKYVLHFGMADPRKNTAHLLAEWGRLPEAVRRAHTLVVVGVEGPGRAHFESQAPPGARVHGYAPEADVADLLSGAAALAYPTTYEGFGLPLLAAFAARTPVVAGNLTSLPEVAGDAAELVDPHAPGAFAAGLARVLTDPAHAHELVRRGAERLRRYSWAGAAEVVAGALADAAGVARPAETPAVPAPPARARRGLRAHRP